MEIMLEVLTNEPFVLVEGKFFQVSRHIWTDWEELGINMKELVMALKGKGVVIEPVWNKWRYTGFVSARDGVVEVEEGEWKLQDIEEYEPSENWSSRPFLYVHGDPGASPSEEEMEACISKAVAEKQEAINYGKQQKEAFQQWCEALHLLVGQKVLVKEVSYSSITLLSEEGESFEVSLNEPFMDEE